jgi:hypothetical protein
MEIHLKRSLTHKPSIDKIRTFGAFLNLLMKGLWSLEMSLWAFCENIFDRPMAKSTIQKSPT